MKHQHNMPFGAQLLDDGAARFRLWAPKVKRVTLELQTRSLPMSETKSLGDEGWFELVTRHAAAGTKYQFAIDRGQKVPDPASRYQPGNVHRASELVDPKAFDWRCNEWRGRPWRETALYELHVGTFSPEGTFAGAENKLDYLADLGITAVEIMPVASFPGQRNWGYDGVLPFAPANCYGRPEDFKHFVDAAHAKNLMVFLDVVYNHFGPEGNYLHLYAPQFFTARHHTPWGQAINFDGPGSRTVRDFFIHNALYWLEEYRIDGLRLDAVHAILDDSRPDILTELAEKVRQTIDSERHVHLVLENDNNAAHHLRREPSRPPRWYTAQWDDDFEHAAHVLVTHESDGYYSEYSKNPAWHLGRCLAEGFSYQGERSPYRDNVRRGEASSSLPPECFVTFLQNHDQVGNRVFGERITALSEPRAVRAAVAVLLLAPSPPLLFMGEEFAANTPFLFFCDFEPDIAIKARDGRRAEFSRFAQFSSPEAQERIPDPGSEDTFLRSKLNWSSLQDAAHGDWLHYYRDLLALRHREIVPRIGQIQAGGARFDVLGDCMRAFRVFWPLKAEGALSVVANFSNEHLLLPEMPGNLLYVTEDAGAAISEAKQIPPLCAAWFLKS